MKSFILKCVSIWVIGSFTPCWATPFNCVPVKLKVVEQDAILENSNIAASGQLFFLKNVSKHSLWLDKAGKTLNASLSSYLRVNNWSAFYLHKKEFALSCAVINPGKVEYANCSKVLLACIPAHSVAINHKNNGWILEDKPWDVFIKKMNRS